MVNIKQDDIIKNWNDIESPLVSVKCLTYNHEKYIESALDGFLLQKTDFPFEVIVHDDASTDKTADIIRKYEKEFPLIIKPIYEKENQYSKKDGSLTKIVNSRIKGEYVALCEGDDYWIDCFKLQKQIDYMKEHPLCTLCFTNAELAGDRTGKMIEQLGRKRYLKKGSWDYNCGEMAMLDFVPTASLVFPTKVYKNYPTLSKDAFQGDILLRLYCTSLGYAHYIEEETCVYRTGVEGSVIALWFKDSEARIKSLEAIKKCFHEFNEISSHRWDYEMNYNIAFENGEIMFLQNKYKLVRGKIYRKIYSDQGMYAFIKYVLFTYFNPIFLLLKKIKNV